MKTCRHCKVELPNDRFYSSKETRDRLQSWCKECTRERARAAYDPVKRASYWVSRDKPRERSRVAKIMRDPAAFEEERQRRRRNRKAFTYKSPRTFLTQKLKQLTTGVSTKRSRWDNTLTPDELVAMWHAQAGLCALSGRPLTYVPAPEKYRSVDTNASIDRINNDLPYTAANCRLVCWDVNRSRGRSSDYEFYAMCEAVVEWYRSQATDLAFEAAIGN